MYIYTYLYFDSNVMEASSQLPECSVCIGLDNDLPLHRPQAIFQTWFTNEFVSLDLRSCGSKKTVAVSSWKFLFDNRVQWKDSWCKSIISYILHTNLVTRGKIQWICLDITKML